MTERLDVADLAAIAAELLHFDVHDLLGVFDVDAALGVLAQAWPDDAEAAPLAEQAARLLCELVRTPLLPIAHLRLAVTAVATMVERNGATVDFEPTDELRKLLRAIKDSEADIEEACAWLSPRISVQAGTPSFRRIYPPTAPDELVEQYLAEVSTAPDLTQHEELELADLIAKGRSAEASAAEVAAAETARQRLVRTHLRLVVVLAQRYLASGTPLLDLIQAGNAGLLHAVDKYDGAKGFRFSTYATGGSANRSHDCSPNPPARSQQRRARATGCYPKRLQSSSDSSPGASWPKSQTTSPFRSRPSGTTSETSSQSFGNCWTASAQGTPRLPHLRRSGKAGSDPPCRFTAFHPFLRGRASPPPGHRGQVASPTYGDAGGEVQICE